MTRAGRFILTASLIISPLMLISAHTQQAPGDSPPTSTEEKPADAAARKRTEAATKRRTAEQKKSEQAARRRSQDDQKRKAAAERPAAGVNPVEVARPGTEHDRDRAEPAQRRDDGRRHPPAPPVRRTEAPRMARVVFVGGYLYDPFFGPYPWWPPTLYPYRWTPRFDGRAEVRVMASPKQAAVYVDGFYAGIVDDFDGLLQPLPLLPGGHTLALYLEGYRTVERRVYLTPGSTFKLREAMEPLPPGIASVPPVLSPPIPAPPPGTFIDVRAASHEQPQPLPSPQAQGFGTLSIRIQPPDAVVRIDGQEWVSTKPGELRLYVSAGRHAVVVGVPERPQFSTEVEVRDGETTELNVSVPPRPTD